MLVFTFFCASIFAIYVLLQLFIALSLQIYKDKKHAIAQEKVSILIAARNEEHNIANVLNSILQQKYPKDLIEIWIGDDNSTDNTAKIIQAFEKKDTRIHSLKIETNFPNIKGKQNVLAHLAHKVSGDIYIITDADIIHPKDWITHLLGGFNDKQVGIVSGPTAPLPNNLFSAMQCIDWLAGMATIKAFNENALPITAVGNNMAIKKEVYWATGGYENIPFSLTEDYKLMEYSLKTGYKHKTLLNKHVFCTTPSISNFYKLFEQRLRWYKGGKDGPWYALASYGLYALHFPILIMLFFLLPMPAGIIALAIKITVDLFVLGSATTLIGKFSWLKYYPLYILYFAFIATVFPFAFLLSSEVDWKGRKY